MQHKRAIVRGTAALAITLPLVAGLTAAAPPKPAENGLPANGSASHLGNIYYPFSPAPGTQAAFPTLAAVNRVDSKGFRTADLWLSFSQNADTANAAVANGNLVSHNNGTTFLDERDTNLSAVAMGRLPNGELLSLDFVPGTAADGSQTITTNVSTDLGATWTKRQGSYALPAGKSLDWLRVNQGFMVLPDGTILASLYTQFTGDAKTSVSMIASTDGGRSWTTRALIVDGAVPPFGATESDFSPTADGRLTIVMRGAPESAGLLQSWSSDQGKTWTKPVKLSAPTQTVTGAVEPSLLLQPNGQLLLTYGRPGDHLLVSASGNGDDWGQYQLLFANTPERNAENTWGSSGYTGLVSLSNGRSLVVGDICAPWGCQADPLDETYGIWGRQIDAYGPGTGRIDLLTLLKAGKISITGSFVSDKNFPETGPNGMVDGSIDAHAAAILKSGSSVTLKLDKPYTINKVGLLMAPGVPQSADIQFSMEGKAWGKPVLKPRDQVSYSMQYTDIEPVTAQYIKFNPTDKNAMSAITELELYSADTDTFENDPVNAVPRGWVNTQLATVVNFIPSSTKPVTAAFESQNALRLLDYSTDSPAKATLPFPGRPAVTVDFDMQAVNRQAGYLVDINSTNAAGGITTPWHFMVDMPSGNVSQYSGGAWKRIGTVAPVDASTWTHVTITADASKATITLGGQTLNAGAPDGTPGALSGFTVSSSGTAPKGGSFYFDNVQVH